MNLRDYLSAGQHDSRVCLHAKRLRLGAKVDATLNCKAPALKLAQMKLKCD